MSYQGTKINPNSFDKSQLKFYAFLLPLALMMVLPIVFIVSHAFKPQSELFAFPPRFFVRRPTMANFIDLIRVTEGSGIPFSRYVVNSLFVTLFGVFLAILFTSLAAYGLSKMKFRGKKWLFEVNTLALMFVPIAVAIPRYLVIARVGLIDTYLAHILPVIVMPVALFLIKQFIDQTPNELLESAKIDGASEMQIYLYIVMPVVAPALATVGILAFQAIWNDVMTSATYIDDESKRTLAFFMLSLTARQGNTVAGQGMAAAASLIMFVPNVILFIFLQSKVMNTMAHSGIK